VINVRRWPIAAVGFLALFGVCAAVRVWAQAEPPRPGAWTLEYSISGGFAPFLHRVTVRDSGELEGVESRFGYPGYHVKDRAPEALMARIRAALADLREPTHERSHKADFPTTTLVVSRGGHEYALAHPGDLVRRLDAAFDAAIASSVAGTWWESGWKLCSPAAQLTADDVDLPIHTLELRADGTLAATWAGLKTARQTLHYEGTWRIDRRVSGFHMNPAPGASVPSDVKPDGQFGIDQNTLTLRNVWFGTVQAPHTPDICELTFTRK
jgi:hypothetical protein